MEKQNRDFKGITENELKGYRDSYAENALSRAMTNALSKTEITDAAFCSKGRPPFVFSVEIPTMGVTNQEKSGRCWIFSALNVLREQAAKKCGLEEFELSQNYVAFWDKFEKVNYFLESMLALADRPLTDRLVTYLLDGGVEDGGQWDMLVGVAEKYGVVPKSAMEETFQSSNTSKMNALLNTKLRQYACALRQAAADGKDTVSLKNEMLAETYRFLCMCFGEPPRTFDFEYTDKDKKYHSDSGLTPLEFYRKYIGLNLKEDYISIINSPTEDKPFYQTYTVDYLGNVAEADPVHYLNLPMEEMEALIIRQLKDGELVWFGSDVGPMGERNLGLWSGECFDFNGTFGIDFSMPKKDRLDFRDSAMNHAMVITGVNLDDEGRPTRWKIENSWSDEHGKKGYYMMSASWFDAFVYQAVINKKYLSDAQKEALGKEYIHLDPWDPMGTLA